MIKISNYNCKYTLKNLYKDVSLCLPHIVQEKVQITPSNLSQKIKEAYKGYKNAQKSPFIVIGKKDIREDKTLIENLGTVSTKPAYDAQKIRQLFQRVMPLSPLTNVDRLVKNHLTQRSIIADAEWDILKNDCFLLANIHAGKEIHLGFVPTKKDIWNVEKNRFSVLGRELFILLKAGYTPYKSPAEIILRPPASPLCIDLSYIHTHIHAVKSPDEVLNYIQNPKDPSFNTLPSSKKNALSKICSAKGLSKNSLG